MIRVSCYTNIDAHAMAKWPTVFCCPPSLGDSVVAESGIKLRIVQISHCISKRDGEPYLAIELH